MAKERVIGIDFGTSTTLIKIKTYVDGQSVGAEELSDYVRFDGANTTVPTVVCYAYDDFLVGYEALHNKEQGDFFANFKMDLVSTDKDVREKTEKFTIHFFKHLYQEYNNQRPNFQPCDREITFISYPAKWSEEVSDTMLRIAEEVGFLNVCGIDEPSAAVHTVMVQNKEVLNNLGEGSKNVLMIDMGAGTTDLALCRYSFGAKKVEILSTWPQDTGGFFGGREVDEALWNRVKEYLADCGINKINNESQLFPSCKSWKESNVSPALAKGRAVENCAFVAPMLNMFGEHKAFPPITRDTFEKLLENYLRQFPDLINGIIHNTPDITHADVDLVILTGGHSQWYFADEIASGVITKFGEINLPKIKAEPWRLVKLSTPQETVSLGMVYQPINATANNLEIPNIQSSNNEYQTIDAITDKPEITSGQSINNENKRVADTVAENSKQQSSSIFSSGRKRVTSIIGRIVSDVSSAAMIIEKNNTMPTDEILTRGFLLLKDGEFKKANRCFAQVHEQDIQNAKAYIGKLCIELNIKNEEELPNAKGIKKLFSTTVIRSLSEMPNFQKALKFADNIYRIQLNGYEEAFQERLEWEKQQEYEKIYTETVEKMRSLDRQSKIETSYAAISIKENYTNLYGVFKSLEGYKDTESLTEECNAIIDRYTEIAYKLKQQEIIRARKGKIAQFSLTAIYLLVLFSVIQPIIQTLTGRTAGGWFLAVFLLHLLLAFIGVMIGVIYKKYIEANGESGIIGIILMISTCVLHTVFLTIWNWSSIGLGLVGLLVFIILGILSALPGFFMSMD